MERINTLAYRVKLARKKRKFSQAVLAEKAGLKQPDISKIELGSIEKTTGIARLARALRVSPAWLEMGSGAEPDWDSPAPGEPDLPPSTFSDNRTPSDSGWQVLQDLAAMPASERATRIAEIHASAENYRSYLKEALSKMKGAQALDVDLSDASAPEDRMLGGTSGLIDFDDRPVERKKGGER